MDPRTHGNKGQRHGVSNGHQFLWVVVYENGDAGCEIVSKGRLPQECSRSPQAGDAHTKWNAALQVTAQNPSPGSQERLRLFLGFHLGPASV